MSWRSTASPPLRSTIGIMVSPFGRELRTQRSGGRMTQNSTPLLRPTCRRAQTWGATIRRDHVVNHVSGDRHPFVDFVVVADDFGSGDNPAGCSTNPGRHFF